MEDEEILVTFQTGKGNDHLVPVFFPPETHKAIGYLTSKEIRQNAGVNPNNLYIFANVQNSDKYVNGWHSLNEMLKKIFKVGSFNATQNRHRMASILAKFSLNQQEMDLIYDHFGHSERMNRNVYQAAAGTQQLRTTGRMLKEVRVILVDL